MKAIRFTIYKSASGRHIVHDALTDEIVGVFNAQQRMNAEAWKRQLEKEHGKYYGSK